MATSYEISHAIMKSRMIQISYEGKTLVVEPYLHGLDWDGRECLYARVPTSRSGSEIDWQLFDASKIERVKIMISAINQTPSDYQRDIPQLRTLYAYH